MTNINTEETTLLKPYQSIKVDVEEEHPSEADLIGSKTRKYSLAALALFATVAFAMTSNLKPSSQSPMFTGTNDIPLANEYYPLEEFSVRDAESPPVLSRSCFDPDGNAVGASGDLNLKPPSSFAGVSFERRNGERCPCSYVEATCELKDPVFGNGPCNNLVIDGKKAAANGYPDVTLNHSLKICNYNTNGNTIRLTELPRKTKVEFFYPIQGSNDKVFLVDKAFNNRDLKPGQCFQVIGNKKVTTSRAKYFMSSFLQGGQRDPTDNPINGGFCYAFTYNKIDFKYDYGFGECRVNTSTSCKLADGTDCKDFMLGLKNKCTKFRATFTAKACNEMNRDIQIQVGSSNYKQNIYERKPDGSYKRIKKELPKEIKGNDCAVFETEKEVNPCEKNFWQINLKGMLYNADAENGYVYKDKECESYTFDELPLLPLGGKGKGGKGTGKGGNKRRRRRRGLASA